MEFDVQHHAPQRTGQSDMITYSTGYLMETQQGKKVMLRTFHCPPHYKVYEEYVPVGPEGEPIIDVLIKIHYDPANPEVIYSPDSFESVVANISNQIEKMRTAQNLTLDV